MINVRNLQIELKTGVLLGLAALVFSFFTGIVSGIGIGTVVFRAFLFMVLFTGIGYGAVTVLKKFVPEIESITEGEGLDTDTGEMPNIGGIAEEETGGSPEQQGQAGGEVFSELNTDEIPRVQPGDNEVDTTLSSESSTHPGSGPDSSAGKLGKHIIASEDTFKYEPKLMAEAVRTMMSKDED